MKRLWILLFFLLGATTPGHAEEQEPTLFRQPTVSRTHIVFSYAGDLWIVSRAGDGTAGGQIYFLRGGELENHVVQLDGADMGSFRQNRADRLLTINTDSVSDIQVKTGGVDASSPLGSGAGSCWLRAGSPPWRQR